MATVLYLIVFFVFLTALGLLGSGAGYHRKPILYQMLFLQIVFGALFHFPLTQWMSPWLVVATILASCVLAYYLHFVMYGYVHGQKKLQTDR